MSDDEYDDDFDGEFLYFDDMEADIADDLAAGTVHSPVLYDHPSFDTYDCPSDWEYYSDDYFDDDPSIVRKNKDADDKSKRSIGGGKSKKKRKLLAPMDEIPDMDLGEAVVVDKGLVGWDNFKGVVWRNSNHTSTKKGELYEPGQGEVVALLKNWREVFKSSQPRSDRRTQIQGGEMGGEAMKVGRKGGKGGRSSGKKENMYDADGDEMLEDVVSRTFPPPPYSLSTSEEQPVPSDKTRSRPGSKLNNVMSISDESMDPKANTTMLPTRQSQPISPSLDSSSHEGQVFSHVEVGTGSSTSVSEAPQPVPRKKRKASVPLDEEEDTASIDSTNTNSTTRSRSKRVATRSKLDGEDTKQPVTRASSSASSSSRGRGRGRGRGKKS
ncbi:hypothetical protein FQN54_007019 [Arachnomyces sp. PD_36]|nr:hypothetical protein FQN54_007019 [Arachnomyces sp. PD_36]